MELEWKKIEVQDRALFLPYLYSLASRSAETTFANLYLWSRQYPTGYAVVGDFLVMKSLEEEVFAFPAGTGDRSCSLSGPSSSARTVFSGISSGLS